MTEEISREESHALIRELKRMSGDTVDIRTFGGFLFAGTLVDVEDELALLASATVFTPASNTFNFFNTFNTFTFNVASLVVNLEALTAISRF